jgi:TolB-like protein
MFTDIVGHDTLLKEDEKKALESLRKNQRIHRRLIKKFNGRLLKEMEGGVLASFSSIIDAVLCALSIQKATKKIEVPIRIGIHLGEVIFEKKDVLGDGVNIASRIQNAINTSGIVISEKVYSDIKNKEEFEIESLGRSTLKGIDSPVGIYKVNCPDDSLLDFTIDTGELIRPYSFGKASILFGIMIIALLSYAVYYFLPGAHSTDKPEKSILVLPFESYLGTDTLDYFVAGMHDALIGNIGKIRALQVKSKTTANTFKDSNKTIPEIAAELGVNAIVETSVICKGDSICLEVRLVSTDEKEEQLWIKEYHEETSQILNLYNIITKEITDGIDVNLRSQEEMFLAESRTVDPDAYDAYLKGRLNLDISTAKSLDQAMEYFKTANDIDPDWAAPYRGLASVGNYKNQYGIGLRSDNISLIYKNLNKILELDPGSFHYHRISAGVAVWIEYDWEKGEREFKKAIELNPSDARTRSFYAHLLSILRKKEDALYHGKISQELDPLNPFTLGLYAATLIENGECEEALKHIEKGLSIDSTHGFTRQWLSDAWACLGDYNKAYEYSKQMFLHNDSIIAHVNKKFQESGYFVAIEEIAKYFEELRNSGTNIRPILIGLIYFRAENFDKALYWYEMAFEENKYDPNLPYISAKNTYDKMKDKPGYIELLKKMNLPVD